MYKALGFLFCLLCITGCAYGGLSVKQRTDTENTGDAPGLQHFNDDGGDKEYGEGDADDGTSATTEGEAPSAGNSTQGTENGTLEAPNAGNSGKSKLKKVQGHGVEQFRLYLSTAKPAFKNFTSYTSRRSRPPQEDYAESAIRLVTFFYGYRRVGLPPRFNHSIEGCKHVEGTHIYPCYASCVVKTTYMYRNGQGIHAYRVGQLLTEINPIAISPEEEMQRDQIVQNLIFCNTHLAQQTKAPCEEQSEFWYCVKDAFMSVLKMRNLPKTTAKPSAKNQTSTAPSMGSSAGTAQTSPAPVRSEAEDGETTEETTTPPTTTDSENSDKRSIKKSPKTTKIP